MIIDHIRTSELLTRPEPLIHVQWKGVDVCLDFHCTCGAFLHIDGETFGEFQCPNCDTTWELGQPPVHRKEDT